MSCPALSAVVATAARSASASPQANVTDGELLRTYARSRAEAPFADLVCRLGPMVLGVCRRVAGDRHLADDAFQAAFVVLARRAGDVRPAEAVRAWLYGVAVRTAREARAVSARRLAREVPMPTLPDRAQEPIPERDADALAILDEEIANLPEHLRSAVVICEIDGVSRKDAAKRLGVLEGTLSSRLAKARKVLAQRLRRRGVALPAGLAVLAHAAISPRLFAQTSALVSSSAPLPPAVAALTHGVLRTMFVQKLIIGPALGLTLAAACLVAQLLVPTATAKDPPKPPARLLFRDDARPHLAANPPGPGQILLLRDSSLGTVSPDGKKVIDFPMPGNTLLWRSGALSPDGKRIAFVVKGSGQPILTAAADEYPLKIVVSTLARPKEQMVVDLPAVDVTVCWSADGKSVIAAKMTELPPNAKLESVRIVPETGKIENLFKGRVLDCARDGKTFLVETFDERTPDAFRLGLWSTGEKQARPLAELKGMPSRAQGRFSPDETKILLIDGDPERKDAHLWGASERVYLLDLKTGKRTKLTDFPENGRAFGIAWSPDGKRLAYTWQPVDELVLKKNPNGVVKATRGTEGLLVAVGSDDKDANTLLTDADVNRATEGYLVVADADGKNAKTIVTDKGPVYMNMVLGWIDWR